MIFYCKKRYKNIRYWIYGLARRAHCQEEFLFQELPTKEHETVKSHMNQNLDIFSFESNFLIQSRKSEGTKRDIEGVGWDMSIPLKLTEVYFPRRPHDTFHSLIWKFWNGGLRGNTFLTVEAPKEPLPLGIKTLGAWRNIKVCPPRIWIKENSGWQQERIYLLSLVINMQRSTVVLFDIVT